MKKFLVLLAMATSSAFAGNYISVDVDQVTPNNGGSKSHAQYVRAGKEIGGLQLGLQSRSARMRDGSGLLNSLEVTGGKAIGALTPFVGVGYDNGWNGNATYTYGLVGATLGAPIGPGFALTGVKTRVGSTQTNMTHQTVMFGTYSVPITKQVSLNLNISKSYQDIKEDAFGLGLGFRY